jgi:hypothetical protein
VGANADRRRKYIFTRAEYVLAGIISITAYESYVVAQNLKVLFGDDDTMPPGGASIGEALLPANTEVFLQAAAFGALAGFLSYLLIRMSLQRQQTA